MWRVYARGLISGHERRNRKGESKCSVISSSTRYGVS